MTERISEPLEPPRYPMARVWGRTKLILQGEKRYLCVIEFHPAGSRRMIHQLRSSQRTATGAAEHGKAVLERYQRLCDLAMAGQQG